MNLTSRILKAWSENAAAYEASQALFSYQDHAHVYVVGGACRDAYVGMPIKDVDLLATGWTADQIQSKLNELPGWSDLTGKSFGVFRYRHTDGSEVEIAMPRTEKSTGPGHTDFEVNVDPNLPLAKDLARRDFSCNAIAFNVFQHTVSDPFMGRKAIDDGIISIIHSNSFVDDPLRIMRALVLVARYCWKLDGITMLTAIYQSGLLVNETPERIQWEFDKLFEAVNTAEALRLAIALGILQIVLPEFTPCIGYDQNNKHHTRMLDDHSLTTLEHLSVETDDRDLKLAGFLHDIGKPASAWVDPEHGTNHFYKKRLDDGSFIGEDHEVVGAEITRKLMKRLRYPNDRIDRVSTLVGGHMWAPFTSQRGARRFINRYGEHVDDLIALRWADQDGKLEYPANDHDLTEQIELIKKVHAADQPTKTADLVIDGNDLIESGIEPGPIMGKILDYLTEEVIDDPMLNDKDMLIAMAHHYKEHG